MPRELDLAGLMFPTLLVLLLIAGICSWLIDGWLARLNLYRWLWFAPLLRLSIFALLFGVAGLQVYR